MLEIKFSGRGGQGVVMASQMLGYAFFRSGMYPQCYSLFGGERRGAPVVSFLRVDKQKILLKCEIKHPNELICFDASLINASEFNSLTAEGSYVLVSSGRPPEAFPQLAGFVVGSIDAERIAASLGLAGAINTTILGAYSRLTGHIPIDMIKEAVSEMVPAKREENVQAVQLGFEGLMGARGRERE